MAAAFGKLMQAQLPMIIEKATPAVEARLKQTFQGVGSQTIVSQLPGLIERAAPEIESMLRTRLRSMSPQEAALFLQSWKRLDMAVQQELGRGYGGKRKTRRRRKSRK